MSDNVLKKVHTAIAFDGIISTIIGTLIVFLPNLSAKFAAGLIGFDLIVVGLIKLIPMMNFNIENREFKLTNLVASLIYIVAGIYIFIDIQSSAISLIVVVGIFTGISWLIEGISQLLMYKQITNNPVVSVLTGFITLVAGFSVLLSPFVGGTIIWKVFGISLIITGAFKLFQYFALKY